MIKSLKIGLLLTAMLASGSAFARDDRKMYSIEEALNAPAASSKLDPNIKLYFGGQKYPKVMKQFGDWGTNKKTNGFNKSDKDACNWTFLSAILEMQKRAREQGGNAVVEIKSNYKNIETKSETEFMCGSGALMSGVALKGKVVSVEK